MNTIKSVIITSALLLCTVTASGAETVNSELAIPVVDSRQFVEMPAETQQLMRKDMQDHLAAISAILGYLANKEFKAAAEVAEKRMGKSSMGKHRATGMGPGRFMPLAMRDIGWGMHGAASNLAEAAQSGDLDKSYAALHKVMNSCVTCHLSFRIR